MVYLITAGIVTSVSLLLVTIGVVKKCKKIEGYDLEFTKAARIVTFFIHSFLTVSSLCLSIIIMFMHYIGRVNPSELAGGIAFIWLVFFIGLFCYKQWLCVVLNREGACWYSD